MSTEYGIKRNAALQLLQRERLIFGAVVAKEAEGVNKYVSISNKPIGCKSL
jgi:hypothetical protein